MPVNKKIPINKAKLPRLKPSRNAFASLVRSIIFQQLSGKAATSILKKFLQLFPGVKFPKPEQVLELKDIQFRSAGVSTQKAAYLRDLAQKFIDGTVSPRNFKKMSDQEIKDHLVRVKGVGSWTADMFLIFALNRPDVLPVGDLGVKKGFQKVFRLRSLPSEQQMQKLAESHRGERTYLSLYMWQIVDGEDAGW